jgi:SAM-dependent methyltransferase
MLDKLRDNTSFLHFSTREIVAWSKEYVQQLPPDYVPRFLDIGLGSARDLLSIRQALGNRSVELIGIESQPSLVEQARLHKIETLSVNIETEAIPLANASLDVVIANHVAEHLKELFWFFGEISRLLKPGGIAMIGCPNLASWHNRAALLFGHQPPAAKLLGAHVRGITMSGFRDFIEHSGYFKVVRSKGSNFYFFPVPLNRLLERMFPSLCASMHFQLRRTDKPGSFLKILDEPIPGIGDTPYRRHAENTNVEAVPQ